MSEQNKGVDPTEYEMIVKDLVEAKFNNVLNGEYSSYHRRQYLGKSGHNHEIDVSIEFRVGGIKFIVLVECKSYRNKVGIGEVLEFSSRIEDIGAHKGVMVTTCGFQKGARVLAKSKGIACVVVVGNVWHQPSPDIAYTPPKYRRQQRLKKRLQAIETRDYFAFAAEENSWNSLRAVHRRLLVASYNDIEKDYGSLHIGFYNLPSGRLEGEQAQSDGLLDSWWEILRSGVKLKDYLCYGLAYWIKDEDGELDVTVKAYSLVKLILSEILATQGTSISIQTQYVGDDEADVHDSTENLLALAEDLMVGSSSDDGYLWNEYSWLLVQTKYTDAAVEAGRRATQIAPEQAAYWDTLGWALFHDRQYAKAAACLEKAIEIELRYPEKISYGTTGKLEIRFHLVSSYLQSSENDKALKTMKEMEELDRTAVWTERARRLLTAFS